MALHPEVYEVDGPLKSRAEDACVVHDLVPDEVVPEVVFNQELAQAFSQTQIFIKTPPALAFYFFCFSTLDNYVLLSFDLTVELVFNALGHHPFYESEMAHEYPLHECE